MEVHGSQLSQATRERREAFNNRPPRMSKAELEWIRANTPDPRKRIATRLQSGRAPVKQRAVLKARSRAQDTTPEAREGDSNDKISPVRQMQLPPVSSRDVLQVTSQDDDSRRGISKQSAGLPLMLPPPKDFLGMVVQNGQPPVKDLECRSRQPSKSSDDEEEMDGLEIEILTLGSKRPRYPSVNDSPDPEEYERQHQVDDDPSPKKKQRTARNPKRSLPVDALITTSERLGSHESTDDNPRELVGDPVSQTTSRNVSVREPKKPKRRGRNRTVVYGTIKEKFPLRKIIQKNMKWFRMPMIVAPPTITTPKGLSEGFNKEERVPTGRLMNHKPSLARPRSQLPSARRPTYYTRQLTIVADRNFADDVLRNRRKRQNRPKARPQIRAPDANHDVEQSIRHSGIATPSTKPTSTLRPTTNALPIPKSLEVPGRGSGVASSLTKACLTSGPPTSSPLREKARRNSQSQSRAQNLVAKAEWKIAQSVPRSRTQRRKDERLTIQQQLSLVTMCRRAGSGSDSSDAKSCHDSQAGSISSDVSPSSEAESASDSDNESQKDEEDQETVETQQVEDDDEEVERQWRPRVPIVALEIDDKIATSPAQVRTRTTNNPEIQIPRPPLLPTAPEEDENTQGSIILGDPNLARSGREIPETQIENSKSFEREVNESQLSYQPDPSSLILDHRNTKNPLVDREIPETQMHNGEGPGHEVHSSQLSYQPSSSYFERASQDLQQSPRKPEFVGANDILRLDPSRIPLLTPVIAATRAVSRLPSRSQKSLTEIAHRTNSYFGTLGSVRRKRLVSVPLLTPQFQK